VRCQSPNYWQCTVTCHHVTHTHTHTHTHTPTQTHSSTASSHIIRHSGGPRGRSCRRDYKSLRFFCFIKYQSKVFDAPQLPPTSANLNSTSNRPHKNRQRKLAHEISLSATVSAIPCERWQRAEHAAPHPTQCRQQKRRCLNEGQG